MPCPFGLYHLRKWHRLAGHCELCQQLLACITTYHAACYCCIVIHTLLSEGFFLPAGDSWTEMVLFIPFCCNHLRMSTQGTLHREYSKLTAKGAILLPGKRDFMEYFGIFEILMFFEKFLIDHISSRLCKWYPFIHVILPSLLHPGKAS